MEYRVKTIYSTSASPWENGFVESFRSRFRDECPKREQLWILTEVRVVIEDFRLESNAERPHSPLSYLSSQRFVFTKPKLRAGPPSRSVAPLRITDHQRSHHINQRREPTVHLSQFPESI